MANDDLDTTYCSCNTEGRGVELTPEGVYICLLCKNQLFVNNAWSPQKNKIKTSKYNYENHNDI